MEWISLILILLLALTLPGVINRTRAKLSGRKGIRMFQHVDNVSVLMRKGAVYGAATSWLFRVAPAVGFGSAFTALLFVPLGAMGSVLHFNGDVVMFAYLLALGRLSLILAAMDTGSSFEGMGASREALYGALVEPALMLVAGTLTLLTGQTSFERIFALAGTLDPGAVVVLLLLAYVLVKIITVEAGRIPVDDPRTHLELTMIHEVMVLDYCGVDLGLITVAGWLKTGALAALAAGVVAATFAYNAAVICLLALGVGVVIGVVESMQARNRLSRNPTWILAVVAVALLVFGVAYLLKLDVVNM